MNKSLNIKNSESTLFSTVSYVLGGSLLVSFLIAVALLHPVPMQAHAEGEEVSDSKQTTTTVNLQPTITVWTTDPDNDNQEVTEANIAADPDESIATAAVKVHVSTNNLTGYTLTIQSNSSDAKLVHEDSNVTATINPITGSGTSTASWRANSSLNNMWGYSLNDNDSYVAVPGKTASAEDRGTVIDAKEAGDWGSDGFNNETTKVTFAAKADLSLPAGTYTDTVVFSAVANPAADPTMQDFTADDCSKMSTWSSSADDLTLKDARDDNTYTIRKLADSKCWMTDNLRLQNKTLTSADSNVTSNFTIPASSDTGFTDGYDWDYEYGDEDSCAGAGGEWSDDYGTCYFAANDDSQTAKVHINTTYGGYYNWYTATAGTGTASMESGNATASICPKGWHLPSGGSAGEWKALIDAQGIGTSGAVSRFTEAPLSLPLSGSFYDGSELNQGGYGRWWSSTAIDGVSAYALVVGSNGNVYPAYYDGKNFGNSVRCVFGS